MMPTNINVKNQIDIDCSGDDVILKFTLPQAISPVELGLGPDERKLGLGLIGLEFAKVASGWSAHAVRATMQQAFLQARKLFQKCS